MANRFGFPNIGFGLGLRRPHYEHVLAERPKGVDWFEIISENFIEAHPGHWQFLADVRAHYPLVMHGVGMSIASTDPLNKDYLTKLKKLADFLNPPWVSDHLCWTGIAHTTTHDLLPVPYTEEALTHVVSKIKQVQDVLERPLVLENPSTYLEFRDSTLREWEFIARMAERSGCGLLLDVNNVYVSAFNHRYDAKAYIDALPRGHIVQIHLAGHQNEGTHIVDTHDDYVIDAVWDLYRYTLSKHGPVTTMVEWDDRIPEFSVLEAELDKARRAATDVLREAA